jgi:hypothetical protein
MLRQAFSTITNLQLNIKIVLTLTNEMQSISKILFILLFRFIILIDSSMTEIYYSGHPCTILLGQEESVTRKMVLPRLYIQIQPIYSLGGPIKSIAVTMGTVC